ncbi:MAG: DUF1080 domain-containing protein [Candidatus Hydrogenedentes bacterium]|nr:DUF1080 domain-containing protein [Candidatus Hydrogenedentota bacterium]
MKQLHLGIIAGMIVTASLNAFAQDWQSLTPGNSLDGWRVLGGEWRITEDGVIVGKAAKDANGWLLYEKSMFADCEITFDFRTPVPTNGGLQLRSHWLPRMPLQEGETIENATRQMHGYQVNVETRRRLGTGIIMEENGRGYLAEPAADAVKTLKQRDWNTVRVVARGNLIEVYLHDVLACRVEDEAFINGYVALQLNPYQAKEEFNEIEYRNVRVKDYGHEGNWRALFDGATLNGWKQWGEEDWQAQEGVIWGKSGPKKSEGYLATEEIFKDFRVRGGFKVTGDGNYGLFYHSTITPRAEDGYPVIAGLQGEVEPGYPGSTGWVYESYQRGWLVEPDHNTMQSTALRVGEWNEIEIRTKGNHVTTWVNGIRVLDLEDSGQKLFEGSFALQLHTGGADGIGWKDLYVLQTP